MSKKKEDELKREYVPNQFLYDIVLSSGKRPLDEVLNTIKHQATEYIKKYPECVPYIHIKNVPYIGLDMEVWAHRPETDYEFNERKEKIKKDKAKKALAALKRKKKREREKTMLEKEELELFKRLSKKYGKRKS